jgi:dolichyl-phosphate mannosyltransferase polypeptide 3
MQSDLPEKYHKAVELLPLWALVSFGCYSLCVIGWSLAHFPTCEKDAASLLVEMDKAQQELKARGVLTTADLNGEND